MIISQIAIAPHSTESKIVHQAQTLANKLCLPLTSSTTKNYDYLLVITANGLELRETHQKKAKPVVVDFLDNKLLYRLNGISPKKELLAKAVGIKKRITLKVLDATAGLGTDAFILANLGCNVTMLERSPIIGSLLEDGLRRLNANALGKKLKLKLNLTQAIDFINKIFYMNQEAPDIIYLDPMYPERTKSALGKKQMRILHAIVGEDQDIADVFDIALKVAQKRVVVKRPKLAMYLCNKKPDIIYSGKSSRFDVYMKK